MFCGQCGAQRHGDAKFCRNCGAAFAAASGPAVESAGNGGGMIPQKRRNSVLIWGLGVVLLIAIAVAGFFMFKGVSEKQKYEELVNEGNKYLEAMDYEKAEIAFLEAIEIEPREEEAYLQLADVYIVQADVDKAIEILEEAEEKIGGKAVRIEEKLQEIESYTTYVWYLEPTIEADDIYYIMNFTGSGNESNCQFLDKYAVIEKDGVLGLIDMDGNLKGGMSYSAIKTYLGEYNMESVDGEFYTLTDDQIGPLWGRGMVSYAYYYTDQLREIYDMEMDLFYDLLERVEVEIPVKRSDVVYKTSDGYWHTWWSSLEGKYAIYGDGELKTDFIYDECGSSADGRMAVCQDGKWGYVDEAGEIIIPLEYDASWMQFVPYGGGNLWEELPAQDYCYAYSDGCVPLCKDGQWELRDIDGNVIIPAGVFEAIRPVYDGKCWVKKDGKWGVIELGAEKNKIASDEAVIDVTVDFEHISDAGYESAVVTACDESGSVIWEYVTGQYEWAQLDRVSEIGVHDGKYYLVEDGNVIALSLVDGTVVWKNSDFMGASPAFDFGEEGTLYICGYFGPDFVAIDKNGNTLKLISVLDGGYYWPSDLECTGNQVIITFEGDPEGNEAINKCYINLDDYTYSY